MKRIISALTAVILLCGGAALTTGCSKGSDQSSTGTSDSQPTDLEGVLEFYKSKPEEQEFQNEISQDKRAEMLKLPEETIKNLSTGDLVEAILNYPFFFDWKRYGNYKDGVDGLNKTMDTMQELQNRSDAASVLLKKYSDQKVYSADDMSGEDPVPSEELFRIEDLEILITQDYVQAQMTDEEKAQFLEVAKQKQDEKNASGIYIIDQELIPEILRNLE